LAQVTLLPTTVTTYSRLRHLTIHMSSITTGPFQRRAVAATLVLLVVFPCASNALRMPPSEGQARRAGGMTVVMSASTLLEKRTARDDPDFMQTAAVVHPRKAYATIEAPGAGGVPVAPSWSTSSEKRSTGEDPDLVQTAPAGPALTVQHSMLTLEAAKSVVSKTGQAKYVAGLSMMAVIAFVFRGKLKQRRQLQQDALRSKDEMIESVTEMLADVKEVPDLKHKSIEPTELAEVPPPMRRLRNIGASYVIPRYRIARCSADSLSFDIPTLPCVWPLRAQLFRPTERGRWAKVQLTVDIIAASGLPPLLTCTRTGPPSPPEECGGTGGTGSPEEVAALRADDVPQSSPGGGPEEGSGSTWLNICNAGGTVVATIFRRDHDGALTVQRQDHSTWDINAHLNAETPWITVCKQGQELGQATSLGRGREEHLQLDTQPDVQSPESCVLLMCMLAVLVFDP